MYHHCNYIPFPSWIPGHVRSTHTVLDLQNRARIGALVYVSLASMLDALLYICKPCSYHIFPVIRLFVTPYAPHPISHPATPKDLSARMTPQPVSTP
ncbi:hypothetical protein VTH06DRAFT_4302 [Thermothelomyces fergusii]